MGQSRGGGDGERLRLPIPVLPLSKEDWALECRGEIVAAIKSRNTVEEWSTLARGGHQLWARAEEVVRNRRISNKNERLPGPPEMVE